MEQRTPEGAKAVHRRQAKSRSIDYAQPVIIHDGTRVRIELVIWFIRHSDRTEVAMKLEKSERASASSAWKKSCEISLSEKATSSLSEHLAVCGVVAAEKEAGKYLVLNTGSGEIQSSGLDSKDVLKAVTHLLREPDLLSQVASGDVEGGLVRDLRRALRIGEMRKALADLKRMLAGGVTNEAAFQDWCENHYWAFGSQVAVRDDVRTISGSDKVDLLVEDTISGFRDIIELKRPDASPLNWDPKHKNFYFSAAASQAIGQCHRYLDVLHDHARQGLLDRPEIVSYYPKATIVIGRSSEWEADRHKALHGLNSRLSNITIWTYDNLITYAERVLDIVDAHENSSASVGVDGDEFDDEIPF